MVELLRFLLEPGIFLVVCVLLVLGYGVGRAVNLKSKRWRLPAGLALTGVMLFGIGGISATGFRQAGVEQAMLAAGMFAIALSASSLGWAMTQRAWLALLISSIAVVVALPSLLILGFVLNCSWHGRCY